MHWKHIARKPSGSEDSEFLHAVATQGGSDTTAALGRLHDLAAILRAVDSPSANPEALCEKARRWVGAEGCAVVECSELSETGGVIVASGTWEGAPLGQILEQTRCDWATALAAGPVAVRREGASLRTARCDLESPVETTALAVPIAGDGECAGALILAFSVARRHTRESMEAAEMLACCGLLWLRHRALRSTVDRLSQRIARLIDDVERLLLVAKRRPSDRSANESA